MTKTSKVYSFSTKKAKKNQTTQTYKSVSYNGKFIQKKTALQNQFMNQIIINKSTKHHFIHFLWLQGLGDFSPTTKEAIYQSVAHASPAGAIIRVGEQVHPFKRLGI